MTLAEFFKSPLVPAILAIFAGLYGWHVRLTLRTLEELSSIKEAVSVLAQSVQDDITDTDIMRWSDYMRRRRGRGRNV
jgi:hypothetical protein